LVRHENKKTKKWLLVFDKDDKLAKKYFIINFSRAGILLMRSTTHSRFHKTAVARKWARARTESTRTEIRPRSSLERDDLPRRLNALEEAINTGLKAQAEAEQIKKANQQGPLVVPKFNFAELSATVKWAYKAYQTFRTSSGDNLELSRELADPLLLIEHLVTKYKCYNRDALLAAAAYRWVRSFHNSGMEDERTRLISIKEKLGTDIWEIVEGALRIRALKWFDLDPDSSQTAAAHQSKIQMMTLWATRKRESILLRAGLVELSLSAVIAQRDVFSSDARSTLLKNARRIHVPLARIIGEEDLSTNIHNLCFKLENPREFDRVSEKIKATMIGCGKKKLIDTVTEMLEPKMGWKRDVHLEVSYRQKSEARAYEKAQRKGQPPETLGDLNGMRLINNRRVTNLPLDPDVDFRTFDRQTHKDLLKRLGDSSLHSYSVLSGLCGRGNKEKTHVRLIDNETGRIYGLLVGEMGVNAELFDYRTGHPIKESEVNLKTLQNWSVEPFSYIQMRVAELALSEPRRADKDRLKFLERLEWEERRYPDIEARFDDYITFPKSSLKKPIKSLAEVPDTLDNLLFSGVQDTFWIRVPGLLIPIEAEIQFSDEMRHWNNTYGLEVGHIYFFAGLREFSYIARDWLKMVESGEKDIPYEGPVHDFAIMAPGNEIVHITGVVGRKRTLRDFLAAADLNCDQAQLDGYGYPPQLNSPYDGDHPVRTGVHIVPVYETVRALRA
jgi:hypothetical protein